LSNRINENNADIMLKLIFVSISSLMATSALWLSEQMALESDRRLMADQKSTRLLDQLLNDVKRLKEENQILSEQFYNFVHEEHVYKIQQRKRSKKRNRKLATALSRTIQMGRLTREEIRALKKLYRLNLAKINNA